MQEENNTRKPFSAKRNKNIITKITVIYSAFYIILKFSAIFQGQWLWANLGLALPFLLLGLAGIYLLKNQRENWIYVIVSILVISFIRYYEAELVVQLHSFFTM
jgi:hypothetical protein